MGARRHSHETIIIISNLYLHLKMMAAYKENGQGGRRRFTHSLKANKTMARPWGRRKREVDQKFPPTRTPGMTIRYPTGRPHMPEYPRGCSVLGVDGSHRRHPPAPSAIRGGLRASGTLLREARVPSSSCRQSCAPRSGLRSGLRSGPLTGRGSPPHLGTRRRRSAGA